MTSSASAAEGSRADAAAIRLRGLPFTATSLDVQQFFSGFKVLDILLCTREGRNTGEAYVVLDSPADVAAARIRLNHSYMGNRYIELFEASENEWQTARNVQAAEAATAGYVVRLRGLPFAASTMDVLDFLGSPELADMDDPLVLTTTYDGRPTGEAYIALGSHKAQQATLAKHKQMLGPRYIEVFPATMSDVVQAKQEMLVNAQQSGLRMQWAAAVSAGRPVLAPPLMTGAVPAVPQAAVYPVASAGPAGMGLMPSMAVAAPVAGLAPYKPYRLPVPSSLHTQRSFAFTSMPRRTPVTNLPPPPPAAAAAEVPAGLVQPVVTVQGGASTPSPRAPPPMYSPATPTGGYMPAAAGGGPNVAAALSMLQGPLAHQRMVVPVVAAPNAVGPLVMGGQAGTSPSVVLDRPMPTQLHSNASRLQAGQLHTPALRPLPMGQMAGGE